MTDENSDSSVVRQWSDSPECCPDEECWGSGGRCQQSCRAAWGQAAESVGCR